MEDYVDIKEYKFEHFSTKTANPFLILITFLFLVLTIYLLFSQKQKVFFNGVGLVQEENLVGIEVSKENEKKILNKNKIIIEGTTFTYKIIEKNIQKDNVFFFLEMDTKDIDDVFQYKIELESRNISSILWEKWKGEK